MSSLRHKPTESDPTSQKPASQKQAPQEQAPQKQATADDDYLDAAREAILAVGWSRTTLTDIARRAGVSRMTLYRRWPDTQTMLADLMTREWGRVVGEALASTPRSSTLLGLSDGVVATVRALRANELLRRIIDVDPELLLPYLLDRRGRSQHSLAATTATVIRASQAEGSVRDGDPDILARSLLLACHGFTLSAHTMTDAATPSRDAEVAVYDAELARLVERFLRP